MASTKARATFLDRQDAGVGADDAGPPNSQPPASTAAELVTLADVGLDGEDLLSVA
jgi:hypothetical protein